MDQELPINLAVLKAANDYASREETRYYLNGVQIEADETGIYYVATDGHMLFVRRETADAPVNPFLGSFIIPSAVIADIKFGKKEHLADIIIAERGGWFIRHRGLRREFKPIDATFPDWRRVLPKAPDKAEPAQFNGAYVGKLTRTGQSLGIGIPYIHHAGECNPAPVTWQTSPDTLAVIMPMRVMPGPFPSWANTATEKAA